MNESKFYYQNNINLKKNMIAFFVCLIIVVIVVTIICTLFVSKISKVKKEETERYLSELSQSAAYIIDNQINADLTALKCISRTYKVRKDFGFTEIGYLQEKAELWNFVRISIMNLDGTSISSDGLNYDFSKDDKLMQVLDGKYIVANADLEYVGDENGFVYAVPLYDNNEIYGAIIACSTMDNIISFLNKKYVLNEGFFNIIEKDGTFAIKSSCHDIIIDSNNFFDLIYNQTEVKQDIINKAYTEIDNNKDGFINFTLKGTNIPMIAQYSPLNQSDLYILLVTTEHNATWQFSSLLNQSIIIMVVIFILLITLTTILFSTYKKNNKKLSDIAFKDYITGGYNQTRFNMEAESIIHSNPPNSYTFIILDICKFKLINDTFGNIAGNKILKYIYTVLKNNLKNEELVCRISADRFALLINTKTKEETLNWVDIVSKEINKFNDRLEQKYYLSLTVGVYMIDNPNLSMFYIQDRANAARKSNSGVQSNHLYSCTFFSEIERQQMLKEKDIENRMEDALNNKEFIVYLQPKVELNKKKIVGAEALVRWIDKEKGLIPPDEFIPFFEKNGFIVKLDLYVFEQVCQYIKNWINANVTPIHISVNLSRVHLRNPNFLEKYIETQKKYEIPPDLLEIELTESLFTENLETVIKAISQIHSAGFECSLDDFGSGYSSLNMLTDVDVDTIKLDKAFFRTEKLNNPKERAIIESVLQMAKKLNMTTVSEGVETQSQLNFLEQNNCDMVQGYVISKPIPITDFEKIAFGVEINPIHSIK